MRSLAVFQGKNYYAMTTYDIDDTSKIPDITTHYPSPENGWKDEVIYFLLTDRFADGDTANNKQTDDGVEYGNVEVKYNGGDFKGIKDKLDYIKSMGFTAIWLTPPIDNQYWLGGDFNFGGYHGYWASDFKNTDKHYGTIAEYKDLVDTAHSKGIRIIQDIVVNHTGDYFTCSKKLTAPDDTSYALRSGSKPFDNPVQIPWRYNNPSIFTEDEFKNNSFYHWTPMVTDFTNLTSYFDNQMSNLDDINTDNPVVENLLRGYFRFWIDKVGVDGYRVDTVMYVKPKFFEGFVNSTESGNLGIREYAKSKGKNDFIMFGEAFHPKDEICINYTKDRDTGANRLDSMIYFPLRFAMTDVFVNGANTSVLSDMINARYTVGYANPDKLVTFVDNHDVARVFSIADEKSVKACYTFVMTIPGVPCLFYGVEQGFKEQRRAMFKGGFEATGKTNETDMYNRSGEWYDFIKAIVSLRKDNSVFRNGKMSIIKDNKYGTGVFSYKMVEGSGGVDKASIAIFNTSNGEITTTLETGFDKGDKFNRVSIYEGIFENSITIGDGGKINLKLSPKSFAVYILKEKNTTTLAQIDNTISITNNFDATIDVTSIKLTGTLKNELSANHSIKILVDGTVQNNSVVVNSKEWSCDLNLNVISNGSRELISMIDTGDVNTYIMSEKKVFNLKKPFVEVASVDDPLGDDTGPKGKDYKIPTDKTFEIHPHDIVNVKVLTSGGDMKIELTMKAITKVWNPNYGFDHMVPSIFIKKKDSTSTANFNPKHNYTFTNGFTWDYLFRPAGWNISMFEKSEASLTNNGTPVTPLPTVTIDWKPGESTRETGTIIFNISSKSIGNPSDLSGYQIFITTWDEDNGNIRALESEPQAFRFGGGDGSVDPLIMDETEVITIP